VSKVAKSIKSVLQKTLPPLVKDIAQVVKPFDEITGQRLFHHHSPKCSAFKKFAEFQDDDNDDDVELDEEGELEAPSLKKIKTGLGKLLQKTLPPLIKDIVKTARSDEIGEFLCFTMQYINI